MPEPIFFSCGEPKRLGDVAAAVGASFDEAFGERMLSGAAPLESASADQVAYFDNPRYLDAFLSTQAGACFVGPRYVDRAPPHLAVLKTGDPYRAFALTLALFHPDAMRPHGVEGPAQHGGISPAAHVNRDALLEENVRIEAGAVIGPRVEIGRDSVIGAHAVIAHDVKIGRGCSIGPGVVLQHALLGNRVILHPGVKAGQDGFGFAMGPLGHLKAPQLGRVIIQDDVEIGANAAIDRGATRDTVIGEGTKIDNLVQIGHNVVIGRHCVIVAQVGIAGSVRIGDFVAIGGQAGIGGHLTIGDGAQIAAASAVRDDVPARARYGGVPAKPIRTLFRELTTLAKLAERGQGGRDES